MPGRPQRPSLPRSRSLVRQASIQAYKDCSDTPGCTTERLCQGEVPTVVYRRTKGSAFMLRINLTL